MNLFKQEKVALVSGSAGFIGCRFVGMLGKLVELAIKHIFVVSIVICR